MRYFLDCEFDGHNGPLLSMALVCDDGTSIHIETTAIASDPWVVENVVPHMGANEATTHPLVQPNQVGPQVRAFIGNDPTPTIIADSPVDIGRFCEALMTDERGNYAPNTWDRWTFRVYDVDCYPTTLSGAVQHNAWWDAMALRAKLDGPEPQVTGDVGLACAKAADTVFYHMSERRDRDKLSAALLDLANAILTRSAA